MIVTAVRGWLRRRLVAKETAIFRTADAWRRADGFTVTRSKLWHCRYQQAPAKNGGWTWRRQVTA